MPDVWIPHDFQESLSGNAGREKMLFRILKMVCHRLQLGVEVHFRR